MHRTVGGLAPLEPGYRRILIAPQPGGGITWAETGLQTPYGRAAVRWDFGDAGMRVEVTVPAGAEAVLRLPGRKEEVLGAGTHVRASSEGVMA
jgi:alpha-L-rhamnosidase